MTDSYKTRYEGRVLGGYTADTRSFGTASPPVKTFNVKASQTEDHSQKFVGQISINNFA
jgi:hypothetical protein